MVSALLILPILSGVMWGAAGIFVRTLSDYGFDGQTIAFTRVLIAMVMMLLLIMASDRRMLAFRRRDIWLFILCAVSMTCLNVFYTIAADELSLSLAAVLLSLSPVFMVLIARVIFGETITRRKVVCIAVSIIGCILVSGFLESRSSISVFGVICGIAAAVFYAAYGIASKKASANGYSVYTTLFYCMLISMIILIPFSDIGVVADYAGEGAWEIGFLILQAAVASFLPYILYSVAMSRLEAGTGSLLAACGEPVAAAMFGLLVFAEVPSPLMVIGMALAIGAMAAICMNPKREGNLAARSER